jgi:SRSO17 transposase
MIKGYGCDFPKSVNNSVGVSRQYCGCLGKKTNCQAGVLVGYVSIYGKGLVTGDLYLPQNRSSDEFSEFR